MGSGAVWAAVFPLHALPRTTRRHGELSDDKSLAKVIRLVRHLPITFTPSLAITYLSGSRLHQLDIPVNC